MQQSGTFASGSSGERANSSYPSTGTVADRLGEAVQDGFAGGEDDYEVQVEWATSDKH